MRLMTTSAWASVVTVILVACGGSQDVDHDDGDRGVSARSAPQYETGGRATGGSATGGKATGGSTDEPTDGEAGALPTSNAGGASSGSCNAVAAFGLASDFDCSAAVDCAKVQCRTEVEACYGPNYADQDYSGGQCESFLSCAEDCNCESTCAQNCPRDETCTSCQTALSDCAQVSCATEVSQCVEEAVGAGGAGPAYTCTDLQDCCTRLTDTAQSDCQTLYSGIVSYGDRVCDLAYSRLGC
jgi:hypothetical protein